MSSASLAVASHASFAPRPHLDSSRLAAISAAIALNLSVVLIASRPLTPIQRSPFQVISPPPTIRLIAPPAVAPPPPPIELMPLPHPTPAPITPVTLPPSNPPMATPVTEGLVTPPLPAPTTVPGAATPLLPPTSSAPVQASLAYLASPLRFPARALQQHMRGTVLLRVLVDDTGKPVQVSVELGSGYALLDRSAVAQVLAGWKFQPTMVNGRAVMAWARVPVAFELR